MQRAQCLLDHARALHSQIDDAGAVHAEHDATLQRRGRVVQMENHVARALKRFDRAVDQFGARLAQHLDRHVRRNAIVVDDSANKLSDLHQMRGRVGRSNKKAFCYLLTPPVSVLTSDSRKRLAALEEFSELGDGFKVAMRDLDIRGAGNLLGAEQSGFINDLGFDTYHKILDDAIQELKENEFKDLFAEELSEKAKLIVPDCIIETDLEILIPEYYVTSVRERLQLYATLDSIKDEISLLQFESSLKDRFGEVPPSVVQLIDTVRLRWAGEHLGFEKISLKTNRFRGTFVSNNDDYFKSDIFGGILSLVQSHSKQCRLKDQTGKPSLLIENINSVEAALKILGPLMDSRKTGEMISKHNLPMPLQPALVLVGLGYL